MRTITVTILFSHQLRMRSMKPARRQSFLFEQQVVNRRDLEGFWDPFNRGSHAVVIAGLIGQHVMLKDTHYGSSVTVESIDTLVYDGHKVLSANRSRLEPF